MKSSNLIVSCFAFLLGLSFSFSQISAAERTKNSGFTKILIYKGDKTGTGPSMPGFQMKPGEEIIVTAKLADDNEKEVQGSDIKLIWKADPELSITPVKGKPMSAKVKALKASTQPLFFSAAYDDGKGKKIKGEVMGLVK